jgi:hypothetical protein
VAPWGRPSFHLLFIYAISYSIPELLGSTNNWGAFLFFAGFCFLALTYVFFVVPDTTGISVERVEDIFNGPWFTAYKRTNRLDVVESVETGDDGKGLEHNIVKD